MASKWFVTAKQKRLATASLFCLVELSVPCGTISTHFVRVKTASPSEAPADIKCAYGTIGNALLHICDTNALFTNLRFYDILIFESRCFYTDTLSLYEKAIKKAKTTEKETKLWQFVLSYYGLSEFSTKQLEKDFGDAAYATIRGFVLKFEGLGLLSSVKYGVRVKYKIAP